MNWSFDFQNNKRKYGENLLMDISSYFSSFLLIVNLDFVKLTCFLSFVQDLWNHAYITVLFSRSICTQRRVVLSTLDCIFWDMIKYRSVSFFSYLFISNMFSLFLVFIRRRFVCYV